MTLLIMEDFAAYDKIPAGVLNVTSRRLLSRFLNPPAMVPLKDGQLPDWSGLAELMDFDYLDIKNFELKEDRTNAVLDAWTLKENSTIGQLLCFLQQLERADILSEIGPFLERDLKAYKKRQEKDKREKEQFREIVAPLQVHEVTDSTVLVPSWRPSDDPAPPFETITTEDIEQLQANRSAPMIYDAFVSFAKSDQSFVKEMAEKLEGPGYNLKLCIAPRQLLLGQQESVVTAELIARRCKRIIIVLSPAFLRSEICDFQVRFAHNISPGSRRKKLIPVIAHPVVPEEIPLILRHVSHVDRSRSDFQDVFYNRLALSLKQSFSWTPDDEGQNLQSIIPPESSESSSSSSGMSSSSLGMTSSSSGMGSSSAGMSSSSAGMSSSSAGMSSSSAGMSSSSAGMSSSSAGMSSSSAGMSSSSSGMSSSSSGMSTSSSCMKPQSSGMCSPESQSSGGIAGMKTSASATSLPNLSLSRNSSSNSLSADPGAQTSSKSSSGSKGFSIPIPPFFKKKKKMKTKTPKVQAAPIEPPRKEEPMDTKDDDDDDDFEHITYV